MFYKQTILQNRSSLGSKLPMYPINLSGMVEEKFNAEMQKGFDDVEKGRVKPATEVFSSVRKKYKL